MSYVDAGYAVALSGLALYAVTLVLRRRRWERALQRWEQPAPGTAGVPIRDERP